MSILNKLYTMFLYFLVTCTFLLLAEYSNPELCPFAELTLVVAERLGVSTTSATSSALEVASTFVVELLSC